MVNADRADKLAAEAKKRGFHTGCFKWPEKNVDVGFESTGSKELDADDAAEGSRRGPAGGKLRRGDGAVASAGKRPRGDDDGGRTCPVCKKMFGSSSARQ